MMWYSIVFQVLSELGGFVSTALCSCLQATTTHKTKIYLLHTYIPFWIVK